MYERGNEEVRFGWPHSGTAGESATEKRRDNKNMDVADVRMRKVLGTVSVNY